MDTQGLELLKGFEVGGMQLYSYVRFPKKENTPKLGEMIQFPNIGFVVKQYPRDPITFWTIVMEPKYLAFRFGDWTPQSSTDVRWARIPRDNMSLLCVKDM